MTDSMIERVARAIFAKLTAHADVLRPGAPFLAWDALPEEQKVMTRAAARAAIEAMREPTPHMIDGVTDWDRAVWRTMLSRALAEHQSPLGEE